MKTVFVLTCLVVLLNISVGKKSDPPAENESGGNFVKAKKGGEKNGREIENIKRKQAEKNSTFRKKNTKGKKGGKKNSTPRNNNKKGKKGGKKNSIPRNNNKTGKKRGKKNATPRNNNKRGGKRGQKNSTSRNNNKTGKKRGKKNSTPRNKNKNGKTSGKKNSTPRNQNKKGKNGGKRKNSKKKMILKSKHKEGDKDDKDKIIKKLKKQMSKMRKIQKKKKTKNKGMSNTKKKNNNEKSSNATAFPDDCHLNEMNPIIKAYTKVENTLRKLKRTVAWWKLLISKRNKVKEGTFNPAFNNLDAATASGTTCGCDSLCSAAPTARTAWEQLGGCKDDGSISGPRSKAYNICDPTAPNNPISLKKPCYTCVAGTGSVNVNVTTPCSDSCPASPPDDTCGATQTTPSPLNYCNIVSTTTTTPTTTVTTTASSSSCAIPTPWTTCGNKRSDGTPVPKEPECCPLTQTIIDHMENICIPQLAAWSSRYRQCFTTITDKECSIPCQDKPNLFTCQNTVCSSNCRRSDCGYEGCLLNATGPEDVAACQCKCFKTLSLKNPLTLGDYPNFPICNETYCGCLDCFRLVGFERLVKKRRDECLGPTDSKLSGNFVDCRYQGRLTPAFINKCKDSFKCNTTSAPTNTTVSSNTPTAPTNTTISSNTTSAPTNTTISSNTTVTTTTTTSSTTTFNSTTTTSTSTTTSSSNTTSTSTTTTTSTSTTASTSTRTSTSTTTSTSTSMSTTTATSTTISTSTTTSTSSTTSTSTTTATSTSAQTT